MKVLSPQQMAHVEAEAIHNGSSESDFMEEAGSGVALIVNDYVEKYNINRTAILLCGKGNNAGDAYVTGINLLHLDYEVFAVQVHPIEECSILCRQNYERFMNEGGNQADFLTEFPSAGIIIDGLFGTGFRGKVEEPYNALIALANSSGLPIIAIDIPSGLNGETGLVEGEAIIATETAFLGLPKTGFFLNDAWNFVGKLRYINFGLPDESIENVEPDLILLSEDILKPLMPTIRRNRHKYEAGLVVGLAGSPGMPGAAMLASTAALRGGAGIVRLLHPDGIQAELSASPFELIRIPFHQNDAKEIIAEMNSASATFIGPGLGRTPQIRSLLANVLPHLEKPCVIDADALYILAEDDIKLPKHTVLTPHHGEMMRLLNIVKKPAITMDFLSVCHDYAKKKGVTLVLKGAPTFILHPDLPISVNSTGDPGMATAGSGDVLTGLIAALLAQGMTQENAACLGVFLHGLSGEHAAEDLTSYGVCASDIIYHFPEAFRFIII
ncbi:MAG: NAD(P)H-hydrate dehydratase [Parachlamydiaceae bacterium]